MNIRDIPSVNRLLEKEYLKHKAPVIELIQIQTKSPFAVLVATILSTRTKDRTTAEVCRRLFKKVKQPHDFDKFTRKQLEKLIFPIGFFHTKATHLKQLPQALDSLFKGKIPDTIENLVQLPGVGRKVANLVVAVAFDKQAICVDIHVHRICNRLGLIKTRNPFDTEMKLRKRLPPRYWKTWNSYLVSFGQTLCAPIKPKCSICPVYRYCGRIGVKNTPDKTSFSRSY